MSNGMIYVVGEDHPEDVFGKAITALDEGLPKRSELREFGILEQIPILDGYEEMMGRYFQRTEENERKYLDGSKGIKFDEETEKVFWEQILNYVESLRPLDSNLVERVLPSLVLSKNLIS